MTLKWVSLWCSILQLPPTIVKPDKTYESSRGMTKDSAAILDFLHKSADFEPDLERLTVTRVSAGVGKTHSLHPIIAGRPYRTASVELKCSSANLLR